MSSTRYIFEHISLTILFIFGCSSDFKTNEKKIMKELDDLQRQFGRAAGKASDLGGAMEATEEIRQWVSPEILSNSAANLSSIASVRCWESFWLVLFKLSLL